MEINSNFFQFINYQQIIHEIFFFSLLVKSAFFILPVSLTFGGVYFRVVIIIYHNSYMDIQSSGGQKSERPRKNSGMESEPAHQKMDLFEDMLNLHISQNQMQNQYEQQQAKTQRKYNKRNDIRKILNSSSSNDRLLPTSLKHDSSRENSERSQNYYETQNSMDEESFRKSFKKRYEESFSVQNTIRDSSSSFSERSESKKSFHQILPQEYRQQEGIIQAQQKKGGCNCKKSQCLKLYCQCFQSQHYCNQNCKCYDCGNRNENAEKHKKAIIYVLARNARGFEDEKVRQDKIEPHQSFSLGIQIEEVKKGCKCRKTHCIKKYCECYHTGSFCGLFCRCEDCYNNQKHQQSEKKKTK